MGKNPKRLSNDPIIDCIVEMRFRPASGSVSDILPGLIYNSFKDRYPNIVRTPESDLPRQVRQVDSELRTRPMTLLKGISGHIGIGDEIVQLSFMRPYRGWEVVRPVAQSLIKCVLETGMVGTISRLSVLYTNVVSTSDDPHDLSPLKIQFSVGESLKRRPSGTSIRFEAENNNSISVIQIQTGATAEVQYEDRKETISGLFLRIDTISTNKIDGLEQAIQTLDSVHADEKEAFFGVLAEQTINSLGAVWE